MKFSDWILNESNLTQLYNSSVVAFPNTKKRQHVVDDINLNGLSWLPYKGVKTLYVKGHTQNINNDHRHDPIILFKKVIYHDNKGDNIIKLNDKNGKSFFINQLNDTNDVVIRCPCEDFKWRFNYTDNIDKSLYGRVRRKYNASNEPGSSNPKMMPGVCKHIMQMMKTMRQLGILK
jgi:hypothetical protein